MTIVQNVDEPEVGRRERRAQAMRAAAKALFLEHGYDSVSLTQIVRRSGGSLSTLYDLFGNKLGLLAAVIDAERNDGIGRLQAILWQDGSPSDILQSAAAHLLDAIADPDFVGLIRLVMSEALTSPEFATRVYADHHEPLIEVFRTLFAHWDETGRARITDPELSAHIFAGLFFHAPQMRALFRDRQAQQVCDRQQRIRHGVAMFLAGAAVPEPDPA
jgi:AcrR family transcriptional regulator